MKDLMLLLKYRLLNLGQPGRKDNSKRNRSFIFLYFFLLLFIFGAMIYPVMINTFSKIHVPLDDSMGLAGEGYYLDDLYFSVISLSILTISILNFIPYLIYSLFDFEELNFLFTLPIRKGIIFIYKSIDGVIGTFMTFAIYIPVALAYGTVRGFSGFVLSLGAGITGYVLVLSLSLPIAALLSIKLSRNIAKRLNGFLILINSVVFLYLILKFTAFSKPAATSLGPLVKIGSSKFLFSTWIMRAAKGEPLEWLLIIVLIVWLFRIAMRISEKMTVDSREKVKPLSDISKSKTHRMGPLKKEMLLLLRGEQSIFFILYPGVFSVIMLLAVREFIASSMVMVIIAAFYSSQLIVLSLSSEFSCWPLPASFPVRLKSILDRKILLITSIYTAIYSAICCLSVLFLSLNPLILITIVTACITFYAASSLGARFYISSGAYKAGSQNRRLGFSANLLLELLTFIISAGNIIVLTLYIYSFNNQFLHDRLVRWLGSDNLINLIGIGIPVLVSLLAIILIRLSFKKQFDRLIEGK